MSRRYPLSEASSFGELATDRVDRARFMTPPLCAVFTIPTTLPVSRKWL
jgi:hypothetical protein